MFLNKFFDTFFTKLNLISEYTYEYNLDLEKFVENLILEETLYSKPINSFYNLFQYKYFFTGNISLNGFHLEINRHFGSSFLAIAVGTFIIKDKGTFELKLKIDYPRNVILFAYYFILVSSLFLAIIAILKFSIGFFLAFMVISVLCFIIYMNIIYQISELKKEIKELLSKAKYRTLE